ncbi:hypothetical protein EVAR_45661_1 [Eumeta japonica]|uniref:Uncharacterized protein n=1 Tax=Eumeta variegata TaxID=151549 RepID=A0A4C1Y643_EUMVA|nr:hypothetical protein EVAR_45661_1 [Eumeta japonica]
MTHCRVPPEPSVQARARNERPLFHSMGRCVRVEERQRLHTTYIFVEIGTVSGRRAQSRAKAGTKIKNVIEVETGCRIGYSRVLPSSRKSRIVPEPELKLETILGLTAISFHTKDEGIIPYQRGRSRRQV